MRRPRNFPSVDTRGRMATATCRPRPATSRTSARGARPISPCEGLVGQCLRASLGLHDGSERASYQEMQALKARREAHKHNLGLRRTASATAIPAVPASGTHTPAIGAPAIGNGSSIVAHDHLSPQSTRLPFATHTSSFGNGKGVDTHKEDTRSISSSSSSSSSDSIVLPNPWARFRYHTREFWAEFLCAITSIATCKLIVQRNNVPHLLSVNEGRGSR